MPDKLHKELDFFTLVKRGLLTGLFLLIAFAGTLLFFTGRLSTLLIASSNQFLESQLNLRVSGAIKGSIIQDGLNIENFILSEVGSNQTLISANDFSAGLHWSSVFKKNVILSHITLKQAIIDSNMWKWHAPESDGTGQTNIIFHELSLDSTIVFLPATPKSDSLYIELYRGSGWLLDGIAYFKTDTGNVRVGSPLNQSVLFSGGASFEVASSGQLIDFGVQIAAGSGLINAEWQGDSMETKLQIPNFDLNKIISDDASNLPFNKFTISNFDIDLSHQAQSWKGSGVGNISINEHESKIGKSHFTWDSSGFIGNATATDGTGAVQLSGQVQHNGNLDFSGVITNLDLSQDYRKIPTHKITGNFNLTGNRKTQQSSVHLTQFSIGSYQVDDLNLRFTRDNGQYFAIDTLDFSIEGSQVALSGTFSPDSLALIGTVNLDDISKWLKVGDTNKLQGSAVIDLAILGTLDKPEIEGTFNLYNLGLTQALTATGVGKFNIRKSEKSWEGDLVVQAGEGSVLEDSLTSLMLAADLTGGRVTLRALNIRSENYILNGNGFISEDSIRVDRLNVMINKLSLSLAEPLVAYRPNASDTTWIIPRSVITVNRGGLALQGQISNSGLMDMDVSGELISVALLNEVLSLDFPLSGDITGQLTVSDKFTNPTITANIVWNKPVFNQFIADKFTFDGVLNNHQIQVTQAEVSLNDSKVFLGGTIPFGFTADQWELARFQPQLFTLKFTNYRMRDLLITKFQQTPIDGTVSGTVNVRGTAEETILEGDLLITDGHFGKIDFNQGMAILNYQKGIVSFDTMGVMTNWGVASGSGYLSAFLDLRPDPRSAGIENPMDLTFKGNFSKLKFLSEYINGLDDISGEFAADMHLYGTYRNPIRDVKLRGHHASLTMGFLDDKITDIHTELTIQDNIMTVNHFTGKMRYNEGTVLQRGGIVPTVTKLFGNLVGIQDANQYNGEIQITGIGDFTSFFHPRFNIRLTGDEIYYRNIAGGVEAISDMNMTIEGQDTLRINAEMPVVNAVYYSNFSTQKTYDVKTLPVVQTSRRMTSYNLHTTFTGNLRIDNNSMSSEFDGDLYLLDYGDGQLRFSGTLDAIEGGKFYYLGNVLTITQGTLSFDPVEFNPTMSFTVNTTIDGKDVYLMLAGDLKEPQLSLAPESTTTLTMDDILTYLTLNQKISGGLTLAANSFRDPVSSYVGSLATKELEKLGGQVFGLDIVDLKGGLSLSDTTRILLGQRISRNLKMTYETDFMLLQPNPDYQFGMEYRVNKNLSIIGNVNQDGLVEVRSRLRYNY